MALLLACHDKVRRFAQLLLRLQDHLAQHGCDGHARDAAQSVLRYFDVAAPLHHADEDEDLYPALQALGDLGLNTRIQALSKEHDELTNLWGAVSPQLRQLACMEADMATGQSVGKVLPDALVHRFATRYVAHAAAEESDVYPAAQRLSVETLARIAEAMVARRTAS